jgi:hypothetical protein
MPSASPIDIPPARLSGRLPSRHGSLKISFRRHLESCLAGIANRDWGLVTLYESSARPSCHFDGNTTAEPRRNARTHFVAGCMHRFAMGRTTHAARRIIVSQARWSMAVHASDDRITSHDVGSTACRLCFVASTACPKRSRAAARSTAHWPSCVRRLRRTGCGKPVLRIRGANQGRRLRAASQRPDSDTRVTRRRCRAARR